MPPLEVYGRFTGVYRPRFPAPVGPITNSPAPNSGPVVCFGDSLTEGYGACSEKSYPALLAENLSSSGIQVINLGKCGETAADGLARLQHDVLTLDPLPRAVVVGFGGNDLMRRRPIPDTFADLEAIVTQLQHAGCLVILLGLRGSWLFKVDYETPFHELATRTRCALVPLCLDGIWGSPWHMSDAAHPNARGYKLLADRIADVLIPLLDGPPVITEQASVHS